MRHSTTGIARATLDRYLAMFAKVFALQLVPARVDWVIEDAQGRLVGVEVKATTTPHARDFKGLRAFAAAVGDRFHRGVVLHTGTTAAPMGERMWALPVDALWRL